jgi:hypothetical protein
MKKKIIASFLLVVFLFGGVFSLNAQWAVVDAGANAQLGTANSMLGQINSRIATLSEQRTQTNAQNKIRDYTKESLDIAKKYYEDILKNPNSDLGSATTTNNPYTGRARKYITQLNSLTQNVGYLNNLNSAGSDLGGSSSLSVGVDVAGFMTNVRNEVRDIDRKLSDVLTRDKFTMNDAERINLIASFEKDLLVLLNATQLYTMRAQRVIIGQKASQKDTKQSFTDL